MAIRDFGESLLADVRKRKDDQAREARERAKSQERKNVLQGLLFKGAVSIGNQVLTNKNKKFLQNENYYARNAKLKSNIAANNKALNDWNTSLAYEDGQDAYYLAKATAEVDQMPMSVEFKNKNPSSFNSLKHTHASELAQIMKQHAKENFEKATANTARWGENPEEAFKKSILKGRPQNLAQVFTLPFVNVLSGQDERTPEQASMDSIERENGLGAQGKVDSKDVKSIFEQTNNFEFALDSAEEIKKFKDNFKTEAKLLPTAEPIKGDIVNVKIVGDFGKTMEVSAYEMKIGEETVGLVRVDTGNEITEKVQNSTAEIKSMNVPSETIEGFRIMNEETYKDTPEGKLFQEFKSEMIGNSDPSDKEIEKFNQSYYGRRAITAQTLSAKFKSVKGWNLQFASTLANQMGIENLKAIHHDPKFGFNVFHSNKSLLTGSDQYDHVIALKALIALEDKGSIPVQGAIQTIKQEIADNLNLDSYYKGLTVSQKNLSIELFKDVKIQDLFPELPSREKILIEKADKTAGGNESPNILNTNISNMPKPPLKPKKRRAMRDENSASKAQRKEYEEVIQAQESFEYQQKLALTSLARANKTLNDIEPNQSGQLAGLVRAAETKKKKADFLYTSYMEKYGEVN